MKGKVVLVTGASSGMGKDFAKALAAEGMTVYAAARRLEKMDELKPLGIVPLKMDITKEEDVQAAVRIIEKDHGGADVLINNAGFGLFGPMEEVSMEEARYQFEVNLFGLARLTQLALPSMRTKRPAPSSIFHRWGQDLLPAGKLVSRHQARSGGLVGLSASRVAAIWHRCGRYRAGRDRYRVRRGGGQITPAKSHQRSLCGNDKWVDGRVQRCWTRVCTEGHYRSGAQGDSRHKAQDPLRGRHVCQADDAYAQVVWRSRLRQDADFSISIITGISVPVYQIHSAYVAHASPPSATPSTTAG